MTRLTGIVLALCCFAPIVRAGERVDEALRLVPRETAICVVVRDLRGHGAAIARSPFIGWVMESPVVQQLGEPKDLQKLRDLEKFLLDQFGATPSELLDDVLGDAVVFAYQPGPPGQPDRETGVVVLRPRKPDVLLRIIGKLNVLQRLSGEIRTIEERTYRDRSYFIREKAADECEYYFLRDGTFAFSGSRQGIEQVIDQELSAPSVSDKAPPLTTALRSLGVDDRMAVCWINPRGFDAELKAKLESTKDPNASAFLTHFRSIWSTADGIALYAHPNSGLEVGCVISADPSRLPVELRELLKTTPNTSRLWASIPNNALFATAGRINLPKVLNAITPFLPTEGRNGLKSALDQGLAPLVGRDRLPRLLNAVGPDWGFWMTAPTPDSGSWLPEWTVAVKLPAEADLAQAASQVMDFGVHLMRIDYNRKHDDQIDLIEESTNGLTLRTLKNDAAFPSGFRPTYAMKEGYLIIAGSPDTVRRFRSSTATQSNPTPLARIAVGPLRDYLRTNRGSLAEAAARDGQKTKSVIRKEIEQFETILGAFDRIELRHQVEEKSIRISLHVDFIKPLK